ncbi:PLP-dependent aminotransferase family protein [Priestia aryabhattai]|uniref:MocR-like pyridoxine biosynthesis transcription factor PdxR n=1 Tax=Priestia TaxID=2800373 RepID=UPI002D7ED69E|nr:PLP-dependent aminotransferase family protein [Priestia megaterium]MEB4887690.1 PLP-dependent aminotransferase family protein [Priestia megaterium]
MTKVQWQPNKKSSISIYQQILVYIRKKITSGEWPNGYRLPSQRKLADELNVNRSTIVTVLEELKSYGFIESKKGSGTMVANNDNITKFVESVNWGELISSSAYESNNRIVKHINDLELEDEFIQLGKGELAPGLFSNNIMSSVIESVSSQINYLGYEEPKGYLPLRKAISQNLKEYDINVSENCILITSGALQGLQLISLGLLQNGSTVFLEEPSYLFSLKMFQSAGISLYGVGMDEHGIKLSDIPFSKKYKNHSALYCIPSFQNPTGVTMPIQRRKELLELSTQQNLLIIEDDVYRDLWFDAPSPKPIKSIEDSNNILYIGSLSKTLSPGLRIGWVVANEQVIDRLADIKAQTDYGTSSISQLIAYEWLNGDLYKNHLKELRVKLKYKRDLMIHYLNKYLSSLATWKVPEGGLFIWVEVKEKFSVQSLYLNMLKEGVLINPGNIYSTNYSNFIRLSFGYASKDQIRKGILTLAKQIKPLLQ